MDLGLLMASIASSAVNLSMTRAFLRLEVICIGPRPMLSTYAAARVPVRFTFTTNFMVVIVLAE